MKIQECDNKMEQVQSDNEAAERVTTAQAWLLREEYAKGQKLLNCDCFVF